MGSLVGVLKIRWRTMTVASPPDQIAMAVYASEIASPTRDPTNLPRTPKCAPDAVELLVAVREPMRTRTQTSGMPAATPTAIEVRASTAPRPRVIEIQPN